MLSSCSEAEGAASGAGEASGGPRGPAAAQLATAAPSVVASTGVGQAQLPAEPVGAAAPWVDLPSLLLGHILSFLYNEDPGLVRTLMQSTQRQGFACCRVCTNPRRGPQACMQPCPLAQLVYGILQPPLTSRSVDQDLLTEAVDCAASSAAAVAISIRVQELARGHV